MHITILTLFPDFFQPLFLSLVGKALEKGLWSLEVVSLRDYGIGQRKTVDAPCYGGGAGMLLRPDVIHHALDDKIGKIDPKPLCLYLSAKGTAVQQQHLEQWSAQQHLVLLCGRYEGVDQRVLDFWNFQEVSIGEFVVCGGEAPALMLIEGCIRWIPGVLGNTESLICESFRDGLLEHPHYTRPCNWMGIQVPDVLISGHHQKINQWRLAQSQKQPQN
jgi:tRNA (guanine37-N1)-methyltransferase